MSSTDCSPGGFRLLGSIVASLLLAACTHPYQPTETAGDTVDCDQPDQMLTVHCGRTPSTAFSPDGEPWAVYVVGEHVTISRSKNEGVSFEAPVQVNAIPEPIYTNGENRPKIAFGPAGEVYLSWSMVTEGRFNGDVRFTRSLDGGDQFEPPRTLNDDGLITSHRFDALHVNDEGKLFLTWLDKRDEVAARTAGKDYPGAALYYTVSTDRGDSFARNRKVADHSCECCRIATAPAPGGEVAVFWRHIFGEELEIRDHGFAILGREGVTLGTQRATRDHWVLDGCPHHGPALASADDDGYHLAWFTAGDVGSGIFYAHYDPDTGNKHQRRQVAGAGASHPAIARAEGRLHLVWKQFDGERTQIRRIISTDGGASWQPEQVLASTAGGSDHPLLVTHEDNVWLSWHTQDEGLRLVAL
ncbi:exo-alpha-sialidase [Marinimicrobium alkaliphilum]|uniref:exo-alpha-sialidase n=1 Tax=Marinimicrobium alkaliphilum TaxID=2202654 RepID=UPI0013002296|nr:exo-alpha-sialidase [Marinimicrobium alkaliphilum]